MKRDSWYGKFLEHPESWCSLIWGAVWRLSLITLSASCAVAFLLIMVVGNWYMITHWAELNSCFGGCVESFWTNLSAAAAAFDITIGICLLVVICFNLHRVVPFFEWLTRNCPKVEWE